MKKYKFIYFDAGLTLIKNNHEELFSFALEDLGVKRSSDDIKRAYHLANKAAMRDGLLHKSDGGKRFAFFFLSFLGVSCSLDDFNNAYIKYKDRFFWSSYPFTKDTLLDLKKKEYGIGLLSNWDRSLRRILEKEGILKMMDEVVISSEVGYEKPDEKIFSIALEKAAVKAEEALLVGDNYYDDVLGARKVNMDAVLINPGQLGIEEIDFDGPVISSIETLKKLL